MTLVSIVRRALLATAVLAAPLMASAQTPIKFQLDWRFEGPAALFLAPAAKGYFKDAKLDVTIDAGNGSGGTVTRVASGTYDMGFADLAALMEFHANNPDAANKPVVIPEIKETPVMQAAPSPTASSSDAQDAADEQRRKAMKRTNSARGTLFAGETGGYGGGTLGGSKTLLG
jgi:hypothetical protein